MSWTNNWAEVERPETLANDLMNSEECAVFLGVGTATLYRWVKNGAIPDGVVFNGTKKWSRTILTNFVFAKHIEQVRLLNERKSA